MSRPSPPAPGNMDASNSEATSGAAGGREFRTTHWSVVLQAGRDSSTQSARALEQLCRTYWYPLYAFARRSGLPVEDAQDATQGFFAHLLEKSAFARADPQRGRFRSFLLASFRNHISQERRKAAAQKRGGGHQPVSLDETDAEDRYQREPADNASPDRLFERRWVFTVIETVLAQLEAEWNQRGKGRQFATMRPFLTGDAGESSHAEMGAQLSISAGAAKVALHRLRQRFHELFRAEVMQTVTSESELQEELQHILTALSS